MRCAPKRRASSCRRQWDEMCAAEAGIKLSPAKATAGADVSILVSAPKAQVKIAHAATAAERDWDEKCAREALQPPAPKVHAAVAPSLTSPKKRWSVAEWDRMCVAEAGFKLSPPQAASGAAIALPTHKTVQVKITDTRTAAEREWDEKCAREALLPPPAAKTQLPVGQASPHPKKERSVVEREWDAMCAAQADVALSPPKTTTATSW